MVLHVSSRKSSFPKCRLNRPLGGCTPCNQSLPAWMHRQPWTKFKVPVSCSAKGDDVNIPNPRQGAASRELDRPSTYCASLLVLTACTQFCCRDIISLMDVYPGQLWQQQWVRWDSQAFGLSSAGPQGTYGAHFSSELVQKPQKMFFTTSCIPAHQIKCQQSAFPCPVITPSYGKRFLTFPDVGEKCPVEHHRSCLACQFLLWEDSRGAWLCLWAISSSRSLFYLSFPWWTRITVLRQQWMINPCSPCPCHLWFINELKESKSKGAEHPWKANFIPSRSLT